MRSTASTGTDRRPPAVCAVRTRLAGLHWFQVNLNHVDARTCEAEAVQHLVVVEGIQWQDEEKRSMRYDSRTLTPVVRADVRACFRISWVSSISSAPVARRNTAASTYACTSDNGIVIAPGNLMRSVAGKLRSTFRHAYLSVHVAMLGG